MLIKVALVDDHHVVRKGIKALIEAEGCGIEVVAEAADGVEAVQAVHDSVPDVVLMDIGMPQRNGIEATRLLLASQYRGKVLFLSRAEDRATISAALRAGGAGFVSKGADAHELLKGVREVHAGNPYFSGKIITLLTARTPAPPHPKETKAELSQRELEVVRAICAGKNVKEIAFELALSVKTVETHRTNVMHKLNTASVVELLKYAIRKGIASPWE